MRTACTDPSGKCDCPRKIMVQIVRCDRNAFRLAAASGSEDHIEEIFFAAAANVQIYYVPVGDFPDLLVGDSSIYRRESLWICCQKQGLSDLSHDLLNPFLRHRYVQRTISPAASYTGQKANDHHRIFVPEYDNGFPVFPHLQIDPSGQIPRPSPKLSIRDAPSS